MFINHSRPYFLKQGLSLDLASAILAGLAGNETPGSALALGLQVHVTTSG